MPDDDWALGQNEVDVRNEGRRNAMLGEQITPSLTPTERADVQQELHLLREQLAARLAIPPIHHEERAAWVQRTLGEIRRLEAMLA